MGTKSPAFACPSMKFRSAHIQDGLSAASRSAHQERSLPWLVPTFHSRKREATGKRVTIRGCQSRNAITAVRTMCTASKRPQKSWCRSGTSCRKTCPLSLRRLHSTGTGRCHREAQNRAATRAAQEGSGVGASVSGAGWILGGPTLGRRTWCAANDSVSDLQKKMKEILAE